MLGGGKDIRPRSGRMGHGIHGTGMATVGKIRRNSPFIAPRLKRQDRLFNKDLSDPPHGGTIMSKWCGDENCLQCVDKEPDPYVHLPREDYDAIRAENQRLRGVIAELVEACDAAGKSGHHVAVGIRVTLGNAKAALQPKEPSHD